jgi:dihydropteroate synthase
VIFEYRGGAWDLAGRARVVGILNLTPDSFYDGGRYLTRVAAVARLEAMASEGADAVDVGAQSTRPGGAAIGPEEEWRRLEPFLVSLATAAGRLRIPLSIDTYHAEVARRALDAGAAMVNDVSALLDPAMADVVVEAEAGLTLMHSLGAPDRLHDAREYEDVAEEVRSFLEDRLLLAGSRGVPRRRIALDPGIGFSKHAEQSLEALRGIPRLLSLGRPVYVGLSRKSFLGALGGGEIPEERLAAGLSATVAAYALGARIFRTHDVRETVAALRLAERLLSPESALVEEAGA